MIVVSTLCCGVTDRGSGRHGDMDGEEGGGEGRRQVVMTHSHRHRIGRGRGEGDREREERGARKKGEISYGNRAVAGEGEGERGNDVVRMEGKRRG